MYGIYMKKHTSSVLLHDGTFTNQSNCFKEQFGIIWHKPRLFCTAGGAKNFLHKSDRLAAHYRIKKYTGPTGENNVQGNHN